MPIYEHEKSKIKDKQINDVLNFLKRRPINPKNDKWLNLGYAIINRNIIDAIISIYEIKLTIKKYEARINKAFFVADKNRLKMCMLNKIANHKRIFNNALIFLSSEKVTLYSNEEIEKGWAIDKIKIALNYLYTKEEIIKYGGVFADVLLSI